MNFLVGEIILIKSGFINFVRVLMESVLVWIVGCVWYGYVNCRSKEIVCFVGRLGWYRIYFLWVYFLVVVLN